MIRIVLMYHDIYTCDTTESGFQRKRDLPYKISALSFEEHVKTIKYYCENNRVSQEHVVFTFDDGGKSFSTVVAPILEKYGFKGLFFISSKFIGLENFLSEDDIIELHNHGHIIGSHAYSHKHLYKLTDAQVDNEWRISITALSKIIGEKIVYASIPNGDTSKRVLEFALKNGIKHIYTSEPTTQVKMFDGMEVIGRYVLLSDSTNEYVMSIILSKKKRLILSCKRIALKIIKSILGANYIQLKNFLFKQ